MIKYKKGDLIELALKGRYDVILHGVNCYCKMADGIALRVATNFPEVKNADNQTQPGDINKLGTFVPVPVNRNNKDFYFVNCYTQFGYAGLDIEQNVLIDYDAYKEIIKSLSTKYPKAKIAMPLIGTGHGGGDLEKIVEITKKYFSNNNVDIIIYSDYQIPPQYHTFKNKFLSLWF